VTIRRDPRSAWGCEQLLATGYRKSSARTLSAFLLPVALSTRLGIAWAPLCAVNAWSVRAMVVP